MMKSIWCAGVCMRFQLPAAMEALGHVKYIFDYLSNESISIEL